MVDFVDRMFKEPELTALCVKDPSRVWEGVRNAQLVAFAIDDWRVPEDKKSPKSGDRVEVRVNPVVADERVRLDWDQWGARPAGVQIRNVIHDEVEVDNMAAFRAAQNAIMAAAARRRVQPPIAEIDIEGDWN